jgi:hypothetical protein
MIGVVGPYVKGGEGKGGRFIRDWGAAMLEVMARGGRVWEGPWVSHLGVGRWGNSCVGRFGHEVRAGPSNVGGRGASR